MALSHYAAAILNLILGGFSWIITRYVCLVMHNFYVTEFPEYAGVPAVGFFLQVVHWGLWLLVMFPTALYLWTQTQKPEVR